MNIRRFKSEDQDFLKEMQYLALFVPKGAEAFSRDILEDPHIRKYYTDFGRDGDQAFIAEIEGEKVGAVWCRVFPESSPGYGFVASDIPELSIALLHEYRGLGIGSKLMASLLDLLKTAKVRGVSLSVDWDNPAINLYMHLGFEIVKEEGNPTMLLLF